MKIDDKYKLSFIRYMDGFEDKQKPVGFDKYSMQDEVIMISML